MGNTSIQLPSPRSKTGSLRRVLMLLLLRSEKTAPMDIFLEYLLIFLVFKRLVKLLFTKSDPSSNCIKFGFLLEGYRILSKASLMDCAFLFFKGIVQPSFEKFSITFKTYLYPPLFSGP